MTSTMHSRHRRSIVFVAFLVCAAPALVRAQLATQLGEQLQRIFQGGDYAPETFGPSVWFDDNRSYGVVERTGTGGAQELVEYDVTSGARTVLADTSLLTPNGAAKPLSIAGYAWTSDKRRALIFTNTKPVWRLNTRGDYWLLDRESRSLRKIGGDAPESSLMFAKLSPDGSRVAYVREWNLYVETLVSGAIKALTSDGSATIVNGTSDWVNEEELGIRDGFRWSPDGRSIAYWQFDTSGVESFTLVNDTAALYPTVTRFPYPKPGTANSAVRVGIVQVESGATRWMKTPGDPRNTYLATLQWTAGSGELLLQQLNRLQNTDDLLAADARTGDVRRVFRDSNKAWVDHASRIIEIDAGKAVIWSSEKDGWRHLYRVALDGSGDSLLTKFDGDVIELDGVDAGNGSVYFTASPASALERFLYRARLDGAGAVDRVTPSGERGTHTYQLSSDGQWAVHTASRADVPPAVDLVKVPSHQVVRTLVANTALKTKLAPRLSPATEFVTVDIGGGVTLDGSIVKPASFDASKKYPVIVYVYGEPASQTVVDRWGGARSLFHRALADQGYIILSFDNRGTPAPKGAAWRKVVYGTVGDLSSKEQAAAIRAFAETHAYVDTSRVGVWGWSGGGSNTLNCMFRFPDVFKVGVSVAPVPDQRLYDTIYQERYMGLPQDNAEGYRVGSPINFADGLKGKLLIVHGSGDDNVHYQGTERLVNRLVEIGKPFDIMVYPNRTHAISEGAGTSLHIHSLIARYFLEHLEPGPR
ncbi:MAG TPA: S9 family peptidase [Vicinamibacterales bacterium]